MTRIGLVSLAFIMMTAAAYGQSSKPQLHGYFSQAWVHSPDNPFFSKKTGNHWNLRELGINGSWDINERFRTAGGVLYRDAGTFSEDKFRIDFLLVDYTYWLTDGYSAGIRLGRVKNQYGIYNSVRDVPHARPGVFVPQATYFQSFRDPFLSVDGASLYWKTFSQLGSLDVDLNVGTGDFDNSILEYQVVQKDIQGQFEPKWAYSLRFLWTPWFDESLTLGFTTVGVKLDFEDAVTLTDAEVAAAIPVLLADSSRYRDYITDIGIDVELNLFSLQYAWGNITFTTEYLQGTTEVRDIEVLNSPRPSAKNSPQSYYLQLEWFANNHWSLYGRYDNVYYNKQDKDGAQFAELSGGNPYTQYAKTVTLGARYFFNSDTSVTAEYTRNHGAALANGQIGVDYTDLQENWNTFIVQFAYHF